MAAEMHQQLKNEYGYPLELFVQNGVNGPVIALRSNCGPASIYFWFSPEQARAAAQAFLDAALDCGNEPEVKKGSAELAAELMQSQGPKPDGPANQVFRLGRGTIGHDPSQDT